MTHRNEKYIVFKKKEWEQFQQGSFARELMLLRALDDAVVIRRQDVFAGPALSSYAHSIGVAARLLKRAGNTVEAKQLQDIADYFSEEAELAFDEGYKTPD